MPLHRGFWLAVRQAKYHGSAKTACLLRPLQFRHNSSSTGSSAVAPSYSTSDNIKNIVTTLGLSRIATMILAGQPNRPLPENYKVDLETMFEGGKQAVGVVTESLAESDDLAGLEGLVSGDCLSGLRRSLATLDGDPEKRSLLRIPPEDVFFAFIPDFRSQNGVQSLLLVTFSLPGLGEIREKLSLQKEVTQQFDEEFKKKLMEVKEGVLGKEKLSTVLREEFAEAEQKLKEIDPFTTFQQNEIVIGNFRFERPNPEADWTIVEMSQVSSVDAWAWPFRKRWKGRLGISLRGYKFNSVLRLDYITDWLAISFISNVFFTNLFFGSMSGPGGMMPPQ